MKHLIYSSTTTLEEAVEMLDKNGTGFLPVVDDQHRLIGIITDGDLRRGILNRNFSLDAIINKNPTVAKTSESHVAIKKRLRELKRRHMPVVDNAGKLVEVIMLDEFETLSKDN